MYKQERAEGNLRFAHLRLRANAAEVALYGGSLPERAALEEALSAALQNQSKIVNMQWLLAGNTRALEYAGALLNYCCIAFAVFYGALSISFRVSSCTLAFVHLSSCSSHALSFSSMVGIVLATHSID